MFWRIKWILALMLLMLMDIGPFPITASLCLYIVIFRPRWFKRFFYRLYSSE